MLETQYEGYHLLQNQPKWNFQKLEKQLAHKTSKYIETYFDQITSRIHNYWINIVHISLPFRLFSLISKKKRNLSQKGATPLHIKNANETQDQAITVTSQ
jgi:hypothetical protein